MAAGALVAILLVSVFSHMPAAKAAGIAVIGSSGLLGSGEYRIMGELQKADGSTAGNVVVSATLQDSSGGFAASISADSFIKTRRPDEEPALALPLADTGIGSRIASYRLDVTSSNAIDKPSTLKVVANSGYYHSAGSHHLVGEVSNTRIVTAKSVVSAAF